MPVMKKEQINLLCKAENALDMCFALLSRQSIPYVVNDFDTGEEAVELFTRDDYWELVALIEDLMQEKSRATKRAKEYMRAKRAINKDYGRSKKCK